MLLLTLSHATRHPTAHLATAEPRPPHHRTPRHRPPHLWTRRAVWQVSRLPEPPPVPGRRGRAARHAAGDAAGDFDRHAVDGRRARRGARGPWREADVTGRSSRAVSAGGARRAPVGELDGTQERLRCSRARLWVTATRWRRNGHTAAKKMTAKQWWSGGGHARMGGMRSGTHSKAHDVWAHTICAGRPSVGGRCQAATCSRRRKWI